MYNPKLRRKQNMVFENKIKLLRKEKSWSQTELAQKIDSDARQISQYEHGKITPSIETIIKIAKVFNVSTDYLLIENTPKNPVIVDDEELTKYIEYIQKLETEDKKCLYHMIDSFMTKNKIKDFAEQLNP